MDKLLILSDWFAPGYKAGGPIQSCVNVARAMQDYFQVYVLTADTDEGEHLPYPNIVSNKWVEFEGSIQVQYVSTALQTIKNIQEVIQTLKPDIIYLNSMFSRVFTIYPLLLFYRNILSPAKIVLTPRGMLHKGALQYKSIKKKLFLFVFRLLNLGNKIYFQATDEQEQTDIIKHLGTNESRVTSLENFPNLGPALPHNTKKEENNLHLVFISRVAAKKNLDFLLQCLRDIPNSIRVQLSIYGPIESEAYWFRCQAIIKTLPSSVIVHYKGSIRHEQVRSKLQAAHFFILLTHGENFGHAIFEAFAASVPVIISNQTPWQKLQEKNIGWDLPLANQPQIKKSLIEAASMNDSEYAHMTKAARQFAEQYVTEKNLLDQYLKLFKV